MIYIHQSVIYYIQHKYNVDINGKFFKMRDTLKKYKFEMIGDSVLSMIAAIEKISFENAIKRHCVHYVNDLSKEELELITSIILTI